MKITIHDTVLDVDVAYTDKEKSQGLMFDKNPKGMIFLYPEGGVHNFWMKNTPCELVLLFCYKGRIVAKEIGVPFSTKKMSGETVSDLIIELPYNKYYSKFNIGMKVRM